MTRLAFILTSISSIAMATAVDGAARQRIVFLGDSITDGHTYPLLIRQALTEADQPAPTVINAGIGGDTAKGMRARLERDVLVHKPDVVTFLAGANDVFKKVEPADYEADVTAIAERLKSGKIELIILTTCVIGPRHAASQERLDQYDLALRNVAKRFGLKVGEVRRTMDAAQAAGTVVLEEDQLHPNFAGQRCIARAVLDALGHADVAVPKDLKIETMPGIVSTWKMRALPDKTPTLDTQSISSLAVDDTWKTYTLPESVPLAMPWMDQSRRQGFAMSVDKIIGPGKSCQGIAELTADAPRDVYFNTGANLQTIWLNGQRIYKNESWTGFHAGKERIAARLKPGVNRIVIETRGQFFLSITDTNDW